jgi:hypothetical protein
MSTFQKGERVIWRDNGCVMKSVVVEPPVNFGNRVSSVCRIKPANFADTTLARVDHLYPMTEAGIAQCDIDNDGEQAHYTLSMRDLKREIQRMAVAT